MNFRLGMPIAIGPSIGGVTRTGSSRTITRLNTAVREVLPFAGTPTGGLLVALLRSAATSAIWTLSEEKRTSDQADVSSHFDPEPTRAAQFCVMHNTAFFQLCGRV